MSTTRRGFMRGLLAAAAAVPGLALLPKVFAPQERWVQLGGVRFYSDPGPGKVLMMEPDPETGGYKHVWTDPSEVV